LDNESKLKIYKQQNNKRRSENDEKKTDRHNEKIKERDKFLISISKYLSIISYLSLFAVFKRRIEKLIAGNLNYKN
jgi:hypothetical protein